MVENIEALHTCCFSSTDLAKYKHGQSTDWHHQLRLLGGATDGAFGSGGLQFPPTLVPGAKVINDFESKGAFLRVEALGESLFHINDATQYAIGRGDIEPPGLKQQVRQWVVARNSPPNDVTYKVHVGKVIPCCPVG